MSCKPKDIVLLPPPSRDVSHYGDGAQLKSVPINIKDV